MKAAKDNLVLVVLPNDRQDTYSLVKRAADIYVGIPTSCIVSNKIRNLSAQYTSNVILKMNLRLKGRDHEFKGLEAAQGLPIESMLVMGADVLHQGVSTGSGAPSISCVVGSSEPTFTKYLPSMRAQAAGEEVRLPRSEDLRMLNR